MKIDLDAAKAARKESNKDTHEVKFGGKRFKLPPECPADFALCLAEENVRGSVNALLGDGAERFWKTGPSMSDLAELVNGAARSYGLAPGEVKASGESS